MIKLQPAIIYGPILSRRLKRSLGVNLMPVDQKVCSMNCCYCQYGFAPVVTSTEAITFPEKALVLAAVEKALRKPSSLDYLTFSGNGEPTLHPDFVSIIAEVRQIVARLRPGLKIALFSNGLHLDRAGMLDALKMIDSAFLKLDAGDEKTFTVINRTAAADSFHHQVNYYQNLATLKIQSMFLAGTFGNADGTAYQNWLSLINQLKPAYVQIYSLDRSQPDLSVMKVTTQRLAEIQQDVQQLGFACDYFC